jgi:hypothetical protein
MRVLHDAGGYEYLPGQRFASNGVHAAPGRAIDHALFPQPLVLSEAFAVVDDHLRRLERPPEALCGFDLRLPTARSLEDFFAFNDVYLEHLDARGLLLDGGDSPLARTNVAPVADAPAEPAVVGFSYTVERDLPIATFVVSGVAELPDDASSEADVIRLGETGADALIEKLEFVVGAVSRRLELFTLDWERGDAVHLYSAHDLASELSDALRRRAITPLHGIRWHASTPPIAGLELEIDVRSYGNELVVV